MNWELFVHGCIGALAPEVVRLYNFRQARKKIKFSRFYLVISLLYVALGGYIASVFPGISQGFWAACIGSSTVLNVNMMVKVSSFLFARLTARPSFEESFGMATRLGSKPAPARAQYEMDDELEKGSGDRKKEGTFWNYTDLL
jgi:hypothetical protein